MNITLKTVKELLLQLLPIILPPSYHHHLYIIQLWKDKSIFSGLMLLTDKQTEPITIPCFTMLCHHTAATLHTETPVVCRLLALCMWNHWHKRRLLECDCHTRWHWCWVDILQRSVDAVFQWRIYRYPWRTGSLPHQTAESRWTCSSCRQSAEQSKTVSADMPEASLLLDNAREGIPLWWSTMFSQCSQ